MYNTQIVADKIKFIAKENGKTAKEILINCNLGANAISELSKGKEMSCISLAKIADQLNISVDYLLGRSKKQSIDDSNKNIPCFVYKLDKPIEIIKDKVLIPIGLINKTSTPAFHIQICKMDSGEFIQSSSDASHDICNYLSSDNASENETVYFKVSCHQKLMGCDLYFSIRFSTVDGNIYKQDFRIQYSSTMHDGDNEGIFSMNSFYSLPYPM